MPILVSIGNGFLKLVDDGKDPNDPAGYQFLDSQSAPPQVMKELSAEMHQVATAIDQGGGPRQEGGPPPVPTGAPMKQQRPQMPQQGQEMPMSIGMMQGMMQETGMGPGMMEGGPGMGPNPMEVPPMPEEARYMRRGYDG